MSDSWVLPLGDFIAERVAAAVRSDPRTGCMILGETAMDDAFRNADIDPLLGDDSETD